MKNKKRGKKRPDPFSAAERDKILAYMKANFDQRVYAYFAWQFVTGMRPEETIALRWSDVDWDAKTIRVVRVRTFGEEEDNTKIKEDRDVDLVAAAIEVLQLMRPFTGSKRVEREGKDRHDTSAEIFERPAFEPQRAVCLNHPGVLARSRQMCNDCYQAWWREMKGKGEKIIPMPHSGGRGKPHPAGPWQDERSQRETYWKPAIAAINAAAKQDKEKIRYRTAYNTRHTYCTVALMAGIPPAYIASQAGHDVRTLLSKYAKWIPGADGGKIRAAMDLAFSHANGADQPALAAG